MTKPGWQTSEFWLTIITLVIPGLLSTVQSAGSADPRFAAAGVALTGLYTIGRTAVKVAADVRAAREAAAQLPPFGGMTSTEKAAAAGNAAAAVLAAPPR